jgi:hypothetical protein
MVTLTMGSSALAFSRVIAVGQEFTAGNMYSRTEFAGFGSYLPFDDAEREEMLNASYLVYSYQTPIAWRRGGGSWVLNHTHYSTTTSKHQRKAFDAIYELS